MRFILSGVTNVVVAVFSVALGLSLLLLPPQNGIFSGIYSQQNSFKTQICIPLNASTDRAKRNHQPLHDRHSESDFSRGETGRKKKFYNSKEQISAVFWASLASLSRRGFSDLPKKFDPDEGVRPSGLYDLDVSVERRQPIEKSAQDGRSVWRGLQ